MTDNFGIANILKVQLYSSICTDVSTTRIKANNNYNDAIKIVTCVIGLPTKSKDKGVKPREQMKVTEIKPGTVVYLSAAVPTRLARRQSAENMERGRLSRNAAPSRMLNKSKTVT